MRDKRGWEARRESGGEEWGRGMGGEKRGGEKGERWEREAGARSVSERARNGGKKSGGEKNETRSGGAEHQEVTRLNAQIVGMRIDPLNPALIALECKIGQEVLRKSLPVAEAMDFKLFDDVEIGFDLSGILKQNEG